MGSKRKINLTNRQMEREAIFREKEIEFKKSGKYKPQKNLNRKPRKKKRKKTTVNHHSYKSEKRDTIKISYIPKRNTDD